MGDYRNTWDDFVTKTNTNNEKLLKGDIKLDQRLLRSTGDMVGLMGGIVGDVLGDVGDAITPDFLGIENKYQEYVEKPVQEAALRLADTEWGEKAIKYAQEHPEGMEDLLALSNVVALGGVGRVANAAARNTPTHVRGFYSGNPLKKLLGSIEASAKGSKDALLSSFSPKALAFQDETGLSRGLIQKAKHTEGLIKRREKLVKEAEAGGKKEKDKLAKFDKKWEGEGSYSEGQLAFTYLFRKQMGENIPKFLEDNFEKLNILNSSVGPDRKGFNKQVFDDPRSMTNAPNLDKPVPPRLQDWLQREVYRAWKLDGPRDRKNTILTVKDPDKQHNMTAQAMLNRSDKTGNTKFFFNFGKSGIDLRSADPQDVISSAVGRSVKSKQYQTVLNKVEQGKPLTEKQKPIYKEAQRRLAAEKPLEYDTENGVFFIRDSFHAGAKELGGVSRIFTMDRKGDVTVLVSDKHDMFGFDPVDGRSLLTVFPPIKYNIHRGVNSKSYNAGELQAEARNRLSRELGKEDLGFKPRGNKIYAGNRAGVASRINQRIAQEQGKFKPTAQQIAAQLPRVASNAALGANYGAGMLTGMDREN